MTGPGVPCHFSHLYLLSPGQYTQEIDQALYMPIVARQQALHMPIVAGEQASYMPIVARQQAYTCL